MHETDIAFSKLNSIPKKDLIKFYESRDPSIIPESQRYTWSGVFYKEIDIVNINAVGWKGNTVFAYYNIENDSYSASYH